MTGARFRPYLEPCNRRHIYPLNRVTTPRQSQSLIRWFPRHHVPSLPNICFTEQRTEVASQHAARVLYSGVLLTSSTSLLQLTLSNIQRKIGHQRGGDFPAGDKQNKQKKNSKIRSADPACVSSVVRPLSNNLKGLADNTSPPRLRRRIREPALPQEVKSSSLRPRALFHPHLRNHHPRPPSAICSSSPRINTHHPPCHTPANNPRAVSAAGENRIGERGREPFESEDEQG